MAVAAARGVEEFERVGLGVCDSGAGNSGISGKWWEFRSFAIGCTEPVLDLVVDRLVVEGSPCGRKRNWSRSSLRSP